MEKKEIIKNFSSKRPEAVGVFGYGSGVFKQTRKDCASQTDVIFAVEDIRLWHKANMISNPADYSFIGKIHLNRENIAKIKGKNNITYFSNIKDSGLRFKYGVIEVSDFLTSLSTWKNLFVAGRFQKPVLSVQSDKNIDKILDYNRRSALIVACLLSNSVTTKDNIYNTLCNLSYLGDVRMTLAENPNKVKNIVNGSFDLFEEMYCLNQDFLIQLADGSVIVRHEVLLSKVRELPKALLDYLDDIGIDFKDLDMVRAGIYSYFIERNRIESSSQIIEGVKTNGIVRSVPYILSKVKKRFIK